MKRFLALATLVACLAAASVAAREVSVPLQVDYPLIRQLLLQQIFKDPGGTARVWGDNADCNYLVLSNPQIGGADGRVRTLSDSTARMGTMVGGACVPMLEWKGSLELLLVPVLEAQGSVLHFRVVDSAIYDAEGRKGLATGMLWSLIKEHAYSRLEDLGIDLNSIAAEARTLMPLVLSGRDQAQLDALLSSLAFGAVEANDAGINISFRFDLPDIAAGKPAVVPEQPLTAEEFARWEAAWQRWDAFLTYVVRRAAADTSLQELRLALLEILLDTRYELEYALTAWTPGSEDPIRALFMRSWDRLAEALRQVEGNLPAQEATRYLTFISAASVLKMLDEVGPQVGLEISADALRKLARIIAPQDTADPLLYSAEVDADLRKLFGFGPPLAAPKEDSGIQINFNFWRSAWADEGGVSDALVARLNEWVPGPTELNPYLLMVRELLTRTADVTLKTEPLEADFHDLYRRLVFATAWKESCWRQFIKKGGKLVAIRSGVGSVGIMQIYLKVWRGFYDPKLLQRDIGYNARAGSEILLHYLRDYAIRKGEHTKTGEIDNLARATYAAYNGGPGQLSRYRIKNTPASLRAIDAAFWEKYQAVKAGGELGVAQCFGAASPDEAQQKTVTSRTSAAR